MAEIVIKLVNGELAGKTMQEINKEVRESVKQLDKAKIGTEEWVKANERLDKAKNLQADMKKQIQGTTQASDMLKQAWTKLPGAQFFGQITESIGMFKQGVGGLVSQFGVLKTAIASTGIGLLVLAVAALVTAFKNFTPVVDKVEQVLGGLSAIVQEVFNRWLNFVGGYIKFITGDFKAGMEQMTGSFNGLADAVKNAYDEGVKLAELQQDLDDRNRGIVISNAQAEASINRLITASKNRTLAEKERLALLDEAEKIAKAQFEKEQQLEKDNFKLLMEKAKQKSDLTEQEILQLAEGTLAQEIEYAKRGDLDDDLLKEIADKYAEMIKMEGQQNVLMEKINNQRDKLAEARAAKEEKAAAERQKREEKELQEYEKWLEKRKALDEKADIWNLARIEANEKKKEEAARKAMNASMQILKDRVAAEEEAAAQRKALAEAEAQMNSEVLEVFNEGVNATIALLGADAKARKKHANEIKALQAGQVVINGAVEISEIAKTYAALGPVGQVLAVARIAFAAIRTAAAVKAINSQKFELGGMVNGPRHSGGGVPIEAEGGEFIFSRKAVAGIGAQTLSALNDHYTKFANGGPVDPYMMRSGSSASTPPLIDYNKLAAVMMQAMDQKIMRLRVINNVGDTEQGIKVLNQIRYEADV